MEAISTDGLIMGVVLAAVMFVLRRPLARFDLWRMEKLGFGRAVARTTADYPSVLALVAITLGVGCAVLLALKLLIQWSA